MNCRHCSAPLHHTFVDLGFAPPSNAYLTAEGLNKPETHFPLTVKVCEHCWLVQTEDYAHAGLLVDNDSAYFSSTSSSWLLHAKNFADQITQELNLNGNNLVIEIASNDGYLLKNFVATTIPCLGIEPTHSTATAAELLGIPVIREFFTEELGKRLAASGKHADLIVGNNVYAHVPDINDFTRGLKALLKPGGTITLEFPHLLRLIEFTQFDTIYHEHFSYLSLSTVHRIFTHCGLRVWNVEKLPTHGGSLRIYGGHIEENRQETDAVKNILLDEDRHGLHRIETYTGFQKRAERIKDDLLLFLIEQKRKGKIVAAYGAAAKGNTLLNFAGIKPDLLPFVCDAAPAKQDKFLPGSHIPIYSPKLLFKFPPSFLIILPWNLSEEIIQQNIQLLERGTKFVTFIPYFSMI